MLFFDDEHRNINDLTRHGVLSILVPNGVNKRIISEGLAEYATKYAWFLGCYFFIFVSSKFVVLLQ